MKYRRTKWSASQNKILEDYFVTVNDKPNLEARNRLASIVLKPEKNIRLWFQNRRQRNWMTISHELLETNMNVLLDYLNKTYICKRERDAAILCIVASRLYPSISVDNILNDIVFPLLKSPMAQVVIDKSWTILVHTLKHETELIDVASTRIFGELFLVS